MDDRSNHHLTVMDMLAKHHWMWYIDVQLKKGAKNG